MNNKLITSAQLLFYTGDPSLRTGYARFLESVKNSRKDLPISPACIDSLSRKTSFSIRPHLIEKWMEKDPVMCRRAWANYRKGCDGYTPSERQVDIGLRDKDHVVSSTWASRMDYTPTKKQVESGLTSEHQDVCLTWLKRMDWTPTPAQVDRGLKDSWSICLAWLKRTDWTPTQEQIERGLGSVFGDIRIAWVKRRDFTPTPKQIEQGLKDMQSRVRDEWMERLKVEQEGVLEEEQDFGPSL